MRLLISGLVAVCGLAAAELPYFAVLSRDAGAWPAVLSSVGMIERPAAEARVFVARAGANASTEWLGRVEKGAILVLEGESSLAEMFGFRRADGFVRVNSVIDVHLPLVPLVWEKGLELPRFEVPNGARVFARERWSGAPVIAGFKRGGGAVLWVAVSPGERGYERLPHIAHALVDLGWEPPFRASGLWAFFDYSYRMRADADYLAARWRKTGIAALHVAAWHFFEADAERDRYLKSLIEACHRQGVLVYAWLELPHVSERFWMDHPEWREQTALLQDAHLDWRRLMDLTNRDCAREVKAGEARLLDRFGWDGVNLAELYFESLEGIANPSRFTPMNAGVRREFRAEHHFDPAELFSTRRDAASQRAFLDYRSGLARRLQEEWLEFFASQRKTHANLDLVLTHVDDRLDAGMRDAIGADSAAVMPLAMRHGFTFLIEDPATVWHLGGERYKRLGDRYSGLAPESKLAVDLNIVERYQDVYPTRQQAGSELFQMVHRAAASFGRIALYAENSLMNCDLAILPSAAAWVSRVEKVGDKIAVEAGRGVGFSWHDAALVDGQVWPVQGEGVVWLPSGTHTVASGGSSNRLRVTTFNGTLKWARYVGDRQIEIAYDASSRAIAVLSSGVARVEVDGVAGDPVRAGGSAVLLPRGQHVAILSAQ